MTKINNQMLMETKVLTIYSQKTPMVKAKTRKMIVITRTTTTTMKTMSTGMKMITGIKLTMATITGMEVWLIEVK